MGTPDPAREDARTTFAAVLRTRPFAVLFGAETISIVGDQLARVALAVLVFDRTGSAAATALTYATTFLPAILGGFALGGLGDRLPRRAVMVGSDLLRAALFVVMSLPHMPIWALLVVLAVAVLFEPAFSAAEVSYLAQALNGEQFRAATGLRATANQVAQVAGFAVGGILVAAIAPRAALLLDAATFLLSALFVTALLPREAVRDVAGDEAAAQTRRTEPSVWRVREFRFLCLLSLMVGFFVVPEGLAIPLGRDLGASTADTGLLLAAIPLGGALGAVALVRWVPGPRRMPVAASMAVLCGLPLLVTFASPPWPVVLVAWLVSGFLAAYQVEVNSAVVQLIPERVRAQWVGIFGSGLVAAQGAGLAIFGLLASWLDASRSIAVAGACGAVCTAVAIHWYRSRETRDAHQTGLVGVSDSSGSPNAG